MVINEKLTVFIVFLFFFGCSQREAHDEISESDFSNRLQQLREAYRVVGEDYFSNDINAAEAALIDYLQCLDRIDPSEYPTENLDVGTNFHRDERYRELFLTYGRLSLIYNFMGRDVDAESAMTTALLNYHLLVNDGNPEGFEELEENKRIIIAAIDALEEGKSIGWKDGLSPAP